MPAVSREQTRALEQGLRAPQTSPPTPLGSMMFQAFARTADEIGAQQASLYHQEANQVLSLGLDYDEQTKRLSSLKGKYTFGLMLNPGMVVPTPTEQEYTQKMADHTKRLQEHVLLDEMAKRIQNADSFEAWEGTRDSLAGTLGEAHSFDFRTRMNALTLRAKMDFSADRINMQQMMNEFANRINNNFLNQVVEPTVEDYDELMKVYNNNIYGFDESKPFISSQLSQVLQRAGTPEVVQDVVKKYKNYLTVEQVERAVREAQKRSLAPDTGDTLEARLSTNARGQHVLGLPLGVNPRFIDSNTERLNEKFLAENTLAYTAPEVIREMGGPPIVGSIEAKLRADLNSDPFSAIQNRGQSISPSTLTLPDKDGRNLDKYEKGLKDRLEQIYQLRNAQYKINQYSGTRAIVHAHTQAEIQALDATYEAATPETKARMALAEYRAFEKKNQTMRYEGHKMNPGDALPFKDTDSAKFLELGLNDGEFMKAFPKWVRMKQEHPGKAHEVLVAYIDSMNGNDPSANNVYDDYTGLAMYAAATSGLNLLDLSVGLTGMQRNVLDPLSRPVSKQGFFAWNKKGNKPSLMSYGTKYSNIIVYNNSPIAQNIKNKTVPLQLYDRSGNLVTVTYSLAELLESNGALGSNNIYMPFAKLVPENGTSITRFRVKVSTSLEKRNANVWYDLIGDDGQLLHIDG